MHAPMSDTKARPVPKNPPSRSSGPSSHEGAASASNTSWLDAERGLLLHVTGRPSFAVVVACIFVLLGARSVFFLPWERWTFPITNHRWLLKVHWCFGTPFLLGTMYQHRKAPSGASGSSVRIDSNAHKWIGRMTLICSFGAAATSLVLAQEALAGWWIFTLWSLSWTTMTFLTWRTAMQGDVDAHRLWAEALRRTALAFVFGRVLLAAYSYVLWLACDLSIADHSTHITIAYTYAIAGTALLALSYTLALALPCAPLVQLPMNVCAWCKMALDEICRQQGRDEGMPSMASTPDGSLSTIDSTNDGDGGVGVNSPPRRAPGSLRWKLSPRIAGNGGVLFLLLLIAYGWSLDRDWLPINWCLACTIVFLVSLGATYAAVEGIYSYLEVRWRQTLWPGKREELVVGIQVISNLLLSCVILRYVVFSSCFSCIAHYVSNEREFGDSFFDKDSTHGLWRLVFGPPEGMDADPANEQCRTCLAWAVRGMLVVTKLFRDSGRNGVISADSSAHVQSRHELIRWYNDFSVRESKKYLQSSRERLVETLAQDGRVSSSDLRDILNDLLCSPASRVDSPDPAQFLASLDNPRFTGEETSFVGTGGLNMSDLQSIMRGDMLKELGPSVCFMLRFSLFIEEDSGSERAPISSVLDAVSLMNETDMRAQDAVFDIPGTVIAGLDPDFDIDAKQMGTIKTAVDVFTQLPFEDQPYYFPTKQHYLAFFRWTLENIIQEDWYFPRWLNSVNGGDDYRLLLSEQKKLSPSLTTFEDPQSDATLGDRSFYGTGQRYMTAMKVPGDIDYPFSFPGNANYYITRNHTEFYQYANKPTSEDLLKMIERFWSDKKRRNITKKKGNRPSTDALQRVRNQIVEIDLTAFATHQTRANFTRAGAILYLDTKTKLPIGIWKTNGTDGRMHIPGGGLGWEHAKFVYRTVERAALASIHVSESHLGWSHAVSVAVLQTIPSNHPLFSLLKPFTYGAHQVNSAAYHLLVREHSVLTHSSGLEDQTDAILYYSHHVDFSKTMPQLLETQGLGRAATKDMPLFSQGLRLWDVHYEYIQRRIDVIYASDEEMVSDETVVRFWHHINTFGRHHDPCVCQMASDLFFDDKDVWPSFEDTRTCTDLLDSAEFYPDKNMVTRRLEFCSQDATYRIGALRNMLERECEVDPKCTKLRYRFEHMRLDMGMKPLVARKQLIDFLATVVWQVTVGHRFNSDNIPYLTDPEHCGVRARATGRDGEEFPITTDVGTYVFGITIGALTTVKSNGLLADWTPIYKYFVDLQTDLSEEEKQSLFNKIDDIHLTYKKKLLRLSRDFLRESASRPKNRQSNVFVPAVQSSSVSV